MDSIFRAYIGGRTPGGLSSHPGQKLNLIVSIIPESNSLQSTNNIPKYVFDPRTYNVPGAGWCPGCAAQDMATCGVWPGSNSAPTCATGGPSGGCIPAAVGVGVWNANVCRMTGGTSCPGANNSDTTGYPVLYEKPIMTAYQTFVKTVFNHYASGGGSDIGAYIGYIRVGLANGGENQPFCTVSPSNVGIWPSPEGLSYDLNPSNTTSPDWFITQADCSSDLDSQCQGKFAFIAGNPAGSAHDGPGYIATMYKYFHDNLPTGVPWQIVGNAHNGPPNNGDTDYAFREAPAILGVAGPPCTGSCNITGFGHDALSEYDLDYPARPCDELWCYLFSTYQDGGIPNLYLQTTEPNNATTFQISSIVSNAGIQTVTCSTNCTNFPSGLPADPGQSPMGLYAQEGFALTTGSGPNKVTYKIAQQKYDTHGNPIAGIIALNKFTCDTNTQCPTPFSGSLYVGDYLPDTIPFAASNYAQTIEVYFCDWEYAFNNANSTSYCQGLDTSTTPQLYRNVLNSY